jgi:Holliday junction DNA helicase RuvB
MTDRIVSSQKKSEETGLDVGLRPQKLADYIGQDRVKENLRILIEAAQARREALDHVLIYGPPGLGKTTLAHVIANEMGVNIRVTAGPVIERAGDLAAILTNLHKGDVLFIDEVHRLGRVVEEVLYPAMEDFALDIVIGKGPGARSIRLSLPHFTIIGATTRLALMTAPLRARFGAVYRLDFYDPAAMEAIVRRSAAIMGIEIDEAGVTEIAHVLLEVDPLGLDDIDRRVLRTIIEKFDGGPVGLETIAAALSEEADTIMDVVEPYLLQLGFLDRTPRGRVATRRAHEHLGIPYQEPAQPGLF